MTADQRFLASMTDAAEQLEAVADNNQRVAASFTGLAGSLAETVPHDARLAAALDDLRVRVESLSRNAGAMSVACRALSARYLAAAELGAEILAELDGGSE